MNRRKSIVFGTSAFVLAVGLGYGLRAFASGIPTSNVLTYSGVLTSTTGVALSGSHSIQVSFYDASTAGNLLCQATAASVTVTNGLFSVALPDGSTGCAAAVGANPNIWVEVDVDSTSTGRTKVGAVPYAVESNHAASADTASASGTLGGQLVPSGAVVAFNLTACPAGWTTLTGAEGRYVVGMNAGGTLGATGGTALADQELRTLAEHAHTLNDPGHTHAFNSYPTTSFSPSQSVGQGTQSNPEGVTTSKATTGITVNSAGDYAASSLAAPYVQLLYCVKN